MSRSFYSNPVPHIFNDEGDCLLNDLRKIDNIRAYHRRDLHKCPHCKWGSKIDFDTWFETPWIKEVHLQSRLTVPGSFVVVSKCSKCDQLSWIHYQFEKLFHDFDAYQEGYGKKIPNPNYDYPLIRKENERLIAEAKAVWDSSLCKTCTRVEGQDPTWAYLGLYMPKVECEVEVPLESGRIWLHERTGGRTKKCEYYLPLIARIQDMKVQIIDFIINGDISSRKEGSKVIKSRFGEPGYKYYQGLWKRNCLIINDWAYLTLTNKGYREERKVKGWDK